jgi:zinc resistance-associated protein
MKRNQKLTLTLITLAALTLGSSSAWARHHWNNGNGWARRATAN